MEHLPPSAVGRVAAGADGWPTLERLVDGAPRLAGHEGERAAAETLGAAFESFADGATVTGFDLPGWWRGDSALAVTAPVERAFDAAHETAALPGTPSGAVTGRLVDLGAPDPEAIATADLEGALALATAAPGADGTGRALHRTEVYRRAADAGAAGLVFAGGPVGCLPPTGWAVLERPAATPGPIPAVGASHEVGHRLSRWADRGAVAATLRVDCENRPTRSHTVEATVGPETDAELLLTAHLDAHDLGDGARDDGAGCALLVAVGRLLAATHAAGELGLRVRLAGLGAEETGFAGAHDLAERTALDRVRAVLNLDGIGGSRTLRVRTPFDRLASAFAAAGEAHGVPVETESVAGVFADDWAFVQRGVPGAAVGSVATDSDRRWGLGRLWSHTHADTLEKLDRRDLRALAVPIAAATARLADGEGIERADPETVRAAVPAAAEAEMRATGRWPWADEGA
jgi:hypothetical protein